MLLDQQLQPKRGRNNPLQFLYSYTTMTLKSPFDLLRPLNPKPYINPQPSTPEPLNAEPYTPKNRRAGRGAVPSAALPLGSS